MYRSARLIFCLFLIVSALSATRLPLVFSQEEKTGALTKEVSGDIVSVDLKNSTIILKQLKDEKSLTSQDVTFYVDSSTYIENDYETITIIGIEVGDKVTVGYITDKTGKNIASNIRVESKE